MKRIIGCLAILAILYSCTKDTPSHNTYQGGIPFTTVATPDSVLVGDTIVVNVHCETQTNGGSVDFLGFQVIENPVHTMNVTAVAFYDFYGTSSGTKEWKYDKALGIPATDTGKYIMRYYNDNTLFQTDTVVVSKK
jgi:hypothetical protein